MIEMRCEIQQGRIHGHQLRTGGQGRKCVFSHFLTRAYGRTDGRMDKASYRVACPQLKNGKWRKKEVNWKEKKGKWDERKKTKRGERKWKGNKRKRKEIMI